LKRVLLVVMPFLPLHRPALGVSALKASAADAGLACDIAYFTFDYAAFIGIDDYLRLDGGLPTQNLTGEWVFAAAAFGDGVASPEEYERDVVRASPREFYDPEFVARLLELPAKTMPFIRACADQIDLTTYDIIGFTSTFQQNCASLALARELKRREPSVTTLFGGANTDGVMGGEWLRQAHWLDVTVSGEADLVFPELILRIRRGEPLAGLPGTWSREAPPAAAPAPVPNMDALPIPDFSDYFDALSRFGRRDILTPELSVETSRGCWWGERHHCTFCGLNGTSMAYRAKSPDRAFDELRNLASTWGVQRFFASDNIIQPRYFSKLFPRLIEEGLRFDIQYEMKSQLRRDHLRTLRRSGTTWFQPGIESLSSHVLQLMDKGVSALVNIQTLKWAREMGFRITWNCLCGFPGERAQDYEEMLVTMRHLTHLCPPASFAVFRLDRFSPLFNEAGARGLRLVRAGRAYRLCYPFPAEALERIAYFFDCERPIDSETLRAVGEAWRFVNTEWEPTYKNCLLAAHVSDAFTLVHDTRHGWPARRELLLGVDRAVLLAADCVQSRDEILATVRKRHPELDADRDQVEQAVDRLCSLGWMLREGGQHLSLTLFSGCADEELGPSRAAANPNLSLLSGVETLCRH
jgi:ribosomal peptide maturation radical SAM protein 1